jgi:hypothetical protein
MIYSSHYLLAPILFCFHKQFSFATFASNMHKIWRSKKSFHIWFKEEEDKLPRK